VSNGVMDVLAILGLILALRVHGGPRRVLVALAWVPVVHATCPGCFGNAASCTFDTNAKCPSIDVPMANAGIVAGLVASAALSLTLTNIISPRFLRLFSRAHLQAVMQLVRRPAPGSIFEIKPDTKLTAILAAVSNGLVTMEQAVITFAGFIDEEADAAKQAALVQRFKLLSSTNQVIFYHGRDGHRHGDLLVAVGKGHQLRGRPRDADGDGPVGWPVVRGDPQRALDLHQALH